MVTQGAFTNILYSSKPTNMAGTQWLCLHCPG